MKPHPRIPAVKAPPVPAAPAVKTPAPVWDARSIGLLAVMTAALAWAYWPVLRDIIDKWASDPQYSHGYLVPLFAGYLLWSRRQHSAASRWRPSWWGVPLLLLAIAMRLVGTFYFVDWLEAVSLLPLLVGAILLIAGPKALRWSWPAVAFLGFMFPLPYRVETALSLPLQRLATVASTYVLQTLGRPAFAEGNVIVVNDARIGVIEACNGLGMLLLFFALATGVALLVRRPFWERLILVVSAVPIAVIVNVVRITGTSVLHDLVNNPRLDAWLHDFAGWLMMPLALVLLWLESRYLARLVVETPVGEKFGRLAGPRSNLVPPRQPPAQATAR